MKHYEFLDYYCPPKAFKTYFKRYKKMCNAGDTDKAQVYFEKAANLIGIAYTTEERKIGGNMVEVPVTKFDSVQFVDFLHNAFKVISVAGNIALYNYSEHRYDFVKEDVYLSFFKQILDGIDIAVWGTKREKEYAKRFLRDVPKQYAAWQVPYGKIVFTNGVLDVIEDKFYPGDDSSIINFHCTGYEFPDETEDVTCPKFLGFLNSIFEDDALVDVVQEMFGVTLLYGGNPVQKIFLLHGTGRNGKGVLCQMLTRIHGADNISTASVAQLAGRFGAAMIYDKIANIATENDMNFAVDTSLLKSVSGNDYITIDQKYEKSFQAKVFCKLIISTNEIVFKDRSRGFEERLLTIPFEYTFVDNPRKGTKERKKNYALEAELLEEIPAIFLWAYEGLKRLRNNHWQFTKCEKVDKLRAEILKEANPVALFFDERVQIKEGAKTKKSDVYASFDNWAFKKRINVGSVVSAQKFYIEFGHLLEENGLTSKTSTIHGTDYFKGISLVM